MRRKIELRFTLMAVFLIGWLAALYTVHAQSPLLHRQGAVSEYMPVGKARGLKNIQPELPRGVENLADLHTNSGQPRSDEKHHKRMIVTPAIIADFSLESPHFFYFDLSYDLYLPGGCCRKPAGHFLLRGPPSGC
jgi:hypothetical protein